MALSKSWVVISDSQVAANAPGDTVLMTGIRDDLINLDERIGVSPTYTREENHDHDGINSALISSVADEAIVQGKLGDYAAGDYRFHENSDVVGTTASSYAKVKESAIGRGGTLRIKFSMARQGGSGQGRAKIYRNGSPVGTERTQGAGPVEYSEDIAGWSAGDLVQVYGYDYTAVGVDVSLLRLECSQGTIIDVPGENPAY